MNGTKLSRGMAKTDARRPNPYAPCACGHPRLAHYFTRSRCCGARGANRLFSSSRFRCECRRFTPEEVRTVVRLRDRKGGDPAEWPQDLRVREFPAVQP